MLFYHFTKGDASEDESRQLEGSEDNDSSYYGDVESLSCDLAADPMSDSEDDLSEMFSKGNFKNAPKLSILRMPYKCSIFTHNSRVVTLCPSILHNSPCQRN